jgi:hypothetical protein
MKKLVYSAIALTLGSVPALASDNGWSGLDKEIEGLTSSLAADKGAGPKIGGWVITSYRDSSDIDGDSGTAGTQKQSGFQFETVRLEITGDVGDYGYKISFDAANGNTDGHASSPNGNLQLKDAYATWKIADQVSGKLGRFKEPLLRSALVSDNRLLFLDRTGLGDILGTRDLGVQLYGGVDLLNWAVAFQDGADGQGNEHKYTVRVTANIVGNGTGMIEGAYGAGDETNVTVGVAYQDDTTLDKGTIIVGEASLNMGPFALAAEIVDFDDGNAGTFGKTLFINDVGGSTPWDVTGSFRITEQYEIALRYQDADDSDNTTSYAIGANRYEQGHGHDIKWQAQWQEVKTDNAIGDISQFAIGLAVSF